ncbi:MAG: flippase [Anaerolineae bacterium]|nr:flippase [Anaerolineae bacterium]
MKLIKNYLYLSGAEIASKVVTFAAIAYLARVAGPSGFGYVEFASAVLLCAGLVVDQGFGPYGAREIAKMPGRTLEVVSEIVGARFILAVATYGIVVLFLLLYHSAPVLTRLVLIYSLGLLVMPLLMQWVFQGHDQMQTVAIMGLVRQGVYAAVVFVFLREADQIWVAAVAEVMGACSVAAYGLWVYRRQFGSSLRARLALSPQLLREGVPIGLGQMFWMIRMFGATVILGLVASPQDVGFFGGAMRILVALHSFVWLYYFNLLPSLARAWKQSHEVFAQTIAQSLHLVAWAGVFSGVVWVAVAPAVMVGAYGPAFAPAGATLQWLAGVFVLAAISGHYRFGLIAAGRQNLEMVTAALGSTCAVVLIPLGYLRAGPPGAAMGLVVAEAVVWLASWWWAHSRLGLRDHGRTMIYAALAAAIGMGLLWYLPLPSLVLRATLAAAAAILLAFALDRVIRHRAFHVVTLSLNWVRGALDKRVHEAA